MVATDELSANGISVEVPDGWDAAIFVQESDPELAEIAMPILHMSTVPLVEDRGDFGSRVVETLAEGDVFLAMVEQIFDQGALLYTSNEGVPLNLDEAHFHGQVLERTLPGQGGCQLFFNIAGRGFNLYIVLGLLDSVSVLLPEINGILESLRIEAA
jgi:hypothetical protein